MICCGRKIIVSHRKRLGIGLGQSRETRWRFCSYLTLDRVGLFSFYIETMCRPDETLERLPMLSGPVTHFYRKTGLLSRNFNLHTLQIFEEVCQWCSVQFNASQSGVSWKLFFNPFVHPLMKESVCARAWQAKILSIHRCFGKQNSLRPLVTRLHVYQQFNRIRIIFLKFNWRKIHFFPII